MSTTLRVRWLSLDVFRGAAVALMILVNNPGSWQHLYPPLAHAAWHGWTLTDLVFPFFLFAVGNALALSAPTGGAPFWPRWLRRTLLVFTIGLLLNAAPFVRWNDVGELVWRDWQTLRLMGVLQRIALAWAAAALIVRVWGARGAAWGSAALLLGYWAACVALGRPGDPYSLEGFFGTALDRQVLGAAHLYRGEGVPFDPEGLASTLPAIAQVLLGYLAGRFVAAHPAGDRRVGAWLVAAGACALALAALWAMAMPVNKKIWTSSYVMLSTGWALGVLALVTAWVERPGRGGPVARFFEVYGQNALAVFVLSGLVPRLWSVLKGPPAPGPAGAAEAVVPIGPAAAGLVADPRALSLAVALLHVAAYALLAWWLAHRRILIRL